MSYVFAGRLGEPLVEANEQAQVTWWHQLEGFGDGSTVSKIANVASPPACTLKFPGMVKDSTTGLWENWFRYYDPEGGRYLQAEPLYRNPMMVRVYAETGIVMNPYAYAANNPVLFIDPSGLDPLWADDLRRFEQAYEDWWTSRPEKFRLWGPLSNALRFFEKKDAPLCIDYARAAAKYMNKLAAAQNIRAYPIWNYEHIKAGVSGLPSYPQDFDFPMTPPTPAHNTIQIIWVNPETGTPETVGTFDPWWRVL